MARRIHLLFFALLAGVPSPGLPSTPGPVMPAGTAEASDTSEAAEADPDLLLFRQLKAPEILVAEVLADRARQRALVAARAAEPERVPLHFWDSGHDRDGLLPVADAPEGFLPAKRAALIELESDHRDMEDNIRRHLRGGYIAPEDREKLRALRAARRAELAALLTAGELEEYELWVSPLANRMRRELWLFAPDEREFRLLHRLRSAFDEQFLDFHEFKVPLGARLASYVSARDQLAKDIRAALGEARHADYERAESVDFEKLYLATRDANRPPDAIWRVFQLRMLIDTESRRLLADRAQHGEPGRARLRAVADFADREAARLSGAASTTVGAVVGQWTAPLREGHAVTFDGPNHSATRFIGGDRSPAARPGAPER